jgi:class 3 adenylate cyclase
MRNDPEVSDAVLKLLRQYGWETGLKKLQDEIRASPDEAKRENLQLLHGWIAAERGAYNEAGKVFECIETPALRPWALLGQAFVMMRQYDRTKALGLLDEIEAEIGRLDDPALRSAAKHARGAIQFHLGHSTEALRLLGEALELLGKNHFATGRILDTLGMVYAAKDNFHAAEEFFAQAIDCKIRFDDQPGLAITLGNLGRLYLDWGYIDKAAHYFERDLEIAQATLDQYGETQMYNHLGQIALERGRRAAAANRLPEARKFWSDSAAWLDQSIAHANRHTFKAKEGYARKDRGLLFLAEGKLAEAEEQTQKALEIFRAVPFDEGTAHANRVLGMIRRQQGRFEESQSLLRAALTHFEESKEQAEVARTQIEMARTRAAACAPRPQITQEYLRALRQAEACRRSELVRQIEEELKQIDAEAYHAHTYRRVRGWAFDDDTTSLISGRRETLTVLYLDLAGSTDFALGRDPEEVMMTLNQMMADFVAVLRKHEAQVSGFRGDGFLALFRERDHAIRAVAAALDLFAELAAFNVPRQILDVPLFKARIGIASGQVFLGNVGTYDKMDYTAIGTTANLGARLESSAEPGLPCISAQTRELLGGRFTYKDDNGRMVHLKGLPEQKVWDVVGWEKESRV